MQSLSLDTFVYAAAGLTAQVIYDGVNLRRRWMPDIYVASDFMPNLLFMNQHDGTFKEAGLKRGVALSNDGMKQAGMGRTIAAR